MKKSIAVLLTLVLIIGAVFFGCGKKDDTPDSTTETTDSRKQEDINNLEDGLSKESLIMISNELLKKGDAGNTLDTAAVRASIMNASEKTVTYAVIAFGLWDGEDKPIAVSQTLDGENEYITRYSYMALKVPAGNIFGGEVLISIADDVAEKAEYIKAIPLSCTYDDGTNWVNSHYEKFLELYEGETFVESDKGEGSGNSGNKEESTTAATGDSNSNSNTGVTGNTSSSGDNQNNTGTNNGNSGSNAGDKGQNGSEGGVRSEYFLDRCIKIFANGTYKMTAVTDPGTDDESSFTMAVKNGNMSMTTTMEDIEATMLYIASEDKTYMMFPSIKMYTEVTEDMMGGDMDMSELTGNFKISAPDNITVTEKTFNGKQVKCESFVLDGIQSNYYFDASGNLVGRDDFNTDGTVSTMIISGFTDNVPDSTFEIPKGYLFVNLGWIMALMGDK